MWPDGLKMGAVAQVWAERKTGETDPREEARTRKSSVYSKKPRKNGKTLRIFNKTRRSAGIIGH